MATDRPGNVYRTILIIINILFILVSIAIVAAAIWFFVERNYLSSVMQNDLFSAASIILFVVGVIVFAISFVGCIGAYRGIVCCLYVYFVINFIMVLLSLSAAFVAAAFSGEIKVVIKNNMNETLLRRYGNNTHNTTINRIVTNAWDRMQIRLNCCAVETEGWTVYQQSSWYQYQLHNNVEKSLIPYVPESCCRRAPYDWDRIIEITSCQYTQGGPPANRLGSFNKYLNYEGCFDAAKTALGEVIWVLFGFGFVLAIMIILAMISSLCLAIKIKRSRKKSKRYSAGKPRTVQL